MPRAGNVSFNRELGVRIALLTGFDDIVVATALEPELTTIRLPAEDLGAEAMKALLERIAGRSPTGLSLPGDLIVRGSTSAPANG